MAMLDCLGDKWKAHNGFKPGYFTVVEKELRKLLPGTTLRAKPNIESKVKGWKEKYGLLADMIRVSGFAWNYERKCVDVDDTTVWEEYERVTCLLFYFVLLSSFLKVRPFMYSLQFNICRPIKE